MSGKTMVLLTAVGCPDGPSVLESVLETLREEPDLFEVDTERRSDCAGRYLVYQFLQLPDGRSDEFTYAMMKSVEGEGIEVIGGRS